VSRTYTILSYPLADPSVWGVVIEREETCRKNLAGDEVVLKWEGATPAPLIAAPQYTHAECLAIMATPAWSEPPPEEPAP
jgi:hypothetical protein